MQRVIRYKSRHPSRRGVVLIIMAACLAALFAFLALAIDVGMLATARTAAQDAADAAALAGIRTLNGYSTNNNYSNVAPNAQAVGAANKIFGTALSSRNVTVNIGRYAYNTSTQQFQASFPGSTGAWTAVQVTVNADVSNNMTFSKLLNMGSMNVQTQATAVHRPRDIAIVLDFTGSMRFASLLGVPYSGTRTGSNNPDTNVPTWGHYSDTTDAALTATSFTSPYDPANITTTTSDGRPPICADFYSDNAGTAAFTPASNSYCTTPGGDKPLKITKNTGATYAQTLYQILGSTSYDSSFETQGYKAYSMATSFSRYTQGPNYYGKTFWIWPPDPSNGSDGQTNDWRQRYFYNYGTTTPCNDNSRLWDSSGNWKAPGTGTYSINYTAILAWIKSTPCPFPSQLQSGRIVYYTSIPSSIDTSTWPPTDMSQRFWKDYIDYVLGVMQTSSGSYQLLQDGSGNKGVDGYGPPFNWGTIQIIAKASVTGGRYMDYKDNPERPKLQFWFGPLTLVDFLGNYNLWNANSSIYGYRYCWWPGTCHESPLYAAKLGIQAALTDISNNNPNDFVSLIMFSCPQFYNGDTSQGRFNHCRQPLGQNFDNMIESLWYPDSTVGNASATVTPYDSRNLDVPRAMGGTSYSMGLMLAYNQLSSNSSLQTYNAGDTTGDAGGNGRKGAQKIVIFETDGQPNVQAQASLVNSGAYNNYYQIRYNSANTAGSEYPTYDYNDDVNTQIYGLCKQLAASDSASPAGYSSSSKPLLIHCLGFGPIFTPGASTYTTAVATLNQMQQYGNVNDGMPDYKIIYGSQSSVTSDLQQAFHQILQCGVPVSLVQ